MDMLIIKIMFKSMSLQNQLKHSPPSMANVSDHLIRRHSRDRWDQWNADSLFEALGLIFTYNLLTNEEIFDRSQSI